MGRKADEQDVVLSGEQDKLSAEMAAVVIYYQHAMPSGAEKRLEDLRESGEANIVVGPARLRARYFSICR